MILWYFCTTTRKRFLRFLLAVFSYSFTWVNFITLNLVSDMSLFSCANYVPTLKVDIITSLNFCISNWLFFFFSLSAYISLQPPGSCGFFLAFKVLSWRQVKEAASLCEYSHFYSDADYILSFYSLHNLKPLAAHCDHPSPEQFTQASFWLPLMGLRFQREF